MESQIEMKSDFKFETFFLFQKTFSWLIARRDKKERSEFWVVVRIRRGLIILVVLFNELEN